MRGLLRTFAVAYVVFAALFVVVNIVFAQQQAPASRTVTATGVPVGFTDLQMWDLIVGFLAPLLVSVIIQSHWDTLAQTICAAIVTIILAAITVYIEGSFSPQDLISSILIIGVTAMNMYNHFWKHTGVTQSIEAATNIFGKKEPVPLPDNPADTGTMPRQQ
jgi:tetrahydromethanopterin S-methyltransferase subunit C